MLLTLVEEATVTGNVGFWVEHLPTAPASSLPRLFCSEAGEHRYMRTDEL
jgi:hypothetical protein